MKMLQDEDLSSDSSDDDYIPSEVKCASDDDGSSGGEDLYSDAEGDGGDQQQQNKKSKIIKNIIKKDSKKEKDELRRKVNPLLAHLPSKPDVVERLEETPEICNNDKQQKEEDIWADFLADTEEKKAPAVKPKSKSWAALLGKKKSKVSTPTDNQKPSQPATASSKSSQCEAKAEEPSTVKITKIFDFAGEKVRVEEEVPADSKEAAQSIASSGGGGFKRGSNLSGLVNSLSSKKLKLSTLEKTKLDWQNFKTEEGITDELKLHTKSKDTYLDKQEFLQRADVRQFEIERDLRLGTRKSGR